MTAPVSSQPDPLPSTVQRLVAASGIFFVILLIICFALTGDETPDDGDALSEWTKFAKDNESNMRIGVMVFGLAAYNFLLFLGWLRSVLGEAELRARGFNRAGYIVLAAGTAGIVGLGVGIGTTGGALADPDTPPEILKAMNDLGAGGWIMASAGMGALFVTIGLVNQTLRAFPAWLGWVALACGLSWVLQLGVLLSEEQDNIFGLFYPLAFLTLIVFCIGASLQFVRSVTRPAATTGTPLPPPPA
jgi:hypothetical protein